MNIIKNENGSVLVLMIAITFIISYLLLTLVTQIETRAASYQRTRTYLTMNLLEQEGLTKLEEFLSEMVVPNDFNKTITLRNNAQMIINAENSENFFTFYYQINYNRNIRTRRIQFCLELGYIRFND